MTTQETTPTAPAEPLGYFGGGDEGWQRTVRIARAQKVLLWVILLTIVLVVSLLGATASAGLLGETGLFAIAIASIAFRIVAFVAQVWAAIRLLRALESRGIVVWVIGLIAGAVIPLLGLILLVIVNQRATKRLQQAGLKVGLMGARIPEGPPGQ